MKIISSDIAVYKIIIKKMRLTLFFFLMYSIIISYIYKTFQIQFKLPFLSIGTIGTALAMLISFSVKISYDRWVE